jgi:hypothetical protein
VVVNVDGDGNANPDAAIGVMAPERLRYRMRR